MPGNSNVYALLVGIDAYQSPVPALRGCRNDIDTFGELLSARGPGDTIHIRTLLNEQATRAAVIAGFREHLAQAGEDDAALFYYSGHGSQEPAPEQWWHLEPDHLDETLVLYDSRAEGQWDLADKELAALIAEVAANHPHVVVVLDCCHSGSGTRATLEDGTAGRRAPTDRRQRLPSDFLFNPGDVEAYSRTPDRAALGDSGWTLPQANHVLLSGCRSNETSKEVFLNGRHRGALSAALETALCTTGGGRTYREIHRQVSANVHNTVRAQTPQLETSTPEDLDRPFLGGAVAALPPYFVLSHAGVEWTIDGGRLHGIEAPVGDEQTWLDIRDTNDSSVATASVTAVRAGDATITVSSGDLDPARVYRGIVTASPLPSLLIKIEGEDGASALRDALVSRDKAGPRLVAEAEPSGEPQFLVICDASGYSVARIGSERALCTKASAADEAVGVLEHVAAWMRVAGLRNGVTQLPNDAVTVSVEAESGPGEDPPGEVEGLNRFEYVREANGRHRPRRYTVTLTNTSQQTLWVALLDLTDTFGIYTDALPVGSQKLAPGEAIPVRLRADVPDNLWDHGVTEVTDVLKLIVSTEDFDPRSMEQRDLDVSAGTRAASGVRGAPRSSLDRLLRRVGTRRAQPQTAGEAVADWYTRDLMVVSVRPRAGAACAPDKSAEVAPGVTLAPHPTLRATVQLSAALDATRDLAAAPVPDALQGEGTLPFGLIATRGGEPEADAVIVTLDEHTNIGAVTRDDPLVLQLERTLENDDHVLPFAWDGEFYIPLGYSRRTGKGSEIVLERLCDPVATQRSLTGSIRILFRKLVGNALGLPPAYPLLRMISITEDGTLTYVKETAAIKQAVDRSKSVLLYVHGIIGDTEGMARSSRLRGTAVPIGTRYDVTLTFDYENLDTPIEENAAALRSMLADAGLSSGHGKRFDIVAHSMGGLVARHMIEFEGGVDVDHLVTLGTPNDGSPWPTVQRWATVALSLAMNSLTAVAWPVTALAAVLGTLEKFDSALDQMEKGSPFLKKLASAPDPSTPYHVIVGNRSLLDVSQTNGKLPRLLERLSPRRMAGEVVDIVFFHQPNDLAVSVASAQALPTTRNPAPVVHVLASDHMSYFDTEASLAKIAELLV
ncbi:caspase family protein [Arthrobacter sp. AK04]|uniref:caspase family protein n=1 Tax=Arthrobacter sp. AK04 TaxID=2900048 RepID=UPI001E295F61|nr:caspase family protein [Arthrobacter sp. AK04]MCD5341536.1 caspase family protein [Arthrobacter sp. AK04]